MFGGIGLLAGCLLMLMFFPTVHRRAVAATRRELFDAKPLTANEIQAEKDQLRAQFAVSVRRLEIGIEEMRAKAMSRAVDAQHADVSRLQVELDKKTAMIFALRAREEVRKRAVRRIVKLLLYVFVRSTRRRELAPPPFKEPEPQLFKEPEPQPTAWQFERQREPDAGELASTAAAIAAVNLKRRRVVSNRR
jgi:hypothetical protein